MDDNKIVKLNIEQKSSADEKSGKPSKFSSSLQSNPILKKMFFNNLVNKKDKFGLRDLFR